MADYWDKYIKEDVPGLKAPVSMPEEEKEDYWSKYEKKAEPSKKLTYEEKHEKYKKDLEDAPNWWKKLDAGTNLVLNKAKSQLPGIPGQKITEDAIGPSLMKGVPVVRNYVPQTPELSKFESEEGHPYIAKGLNIAGTVGSMAAPLGGASNLMARSSLPVLGAGTNLLPDI